MSNFLLGGRMGDLIHALWVVKNTPGKHDLFITDRRDLHSDGFVLPLAQTIEELRPILMQQDYVNSLQPYKDEEVINLSMWRRYAYSASWTQLLSNTFTVPVNGNRWVELPVLPIYKDLVIIHCSIHESRRGNWSNVDISNGYFIGNDEEYKIFGRRLPRLCPCTLLETFNIINSCAAFIGNQSMPLAIAHAVDKPRIGVLNEVDKLAYIGEEKFYPNFSYVL